MSRHEKKQFDPHMQEEVCTICADASNQLPKVRLECGHCFPVECCVQWFRYHHTSCPNCRDVSFPCTAVMSPTRRVRMLVRRKDKMPGAIRRKVGLLQHRKARLQELKRSLDDYCKENKQVFKGLRSLRRKMVTMANKCDDLHEELSRTPCPNVPLIEEEQEEEL